MTGHLRCRHCGTRFDTYIARSRHVHTEHPGQVALLIPATVRRAGKAHARLAKLPSDVYPRRA